jgi:hypothetical protein
MKSIGQIFIFSILKTFTEIFFLTFCLLCPVQQARGQVTENFNDNDLTQNPLWSGQIENFSDASGTLQLTAPPETGAAFISTLNSVISDMVWEVTLELHFNPSASNFCRIYLCSDSSDLNGSLNGYFVMIGNSADEVSLYRQTGSSKVKIIDGLDGTLDSDIVRLRIMVTRSSTAEWQLLADRGNTGQFTFEGSVTDTVHNTADYTGLQCVYSATRSDKFYFDDFFIRPLADTTPLEVNSIAALSATKLQVEFSEIPDSASAKLTTNYHVENSSGSPETVEVVKNSSIVELKFGSEFPVGINRLIVTGVKDRAANSMLPDTIAFAYVPTVVAEFKDIVINEFMADPSPRSGLPETEFIELYNRSGKTFNLSDWHISDGNTSAAIEREIVLLPQEYLIICPQEIADSFLSFGKVIGVKNFPSLNNGGDNIILSNSKSITIDSLWYSDSWYKDSEKKEGGWSLEIIDPDDLCSAGQNWVASEDTSGGTPGKINSSDAENPDLTGPVLKLAYLIFPDTIKLIFNEPLSRSLPAVDDFVFSMERSVTNIQMDVSRTSIALVTTPGFNPGESLSLTLNGIFDCAGNELQLSSRQAELFLPEIADSADVLLNEVLFNPRPDGTDFVELFNVSPKYIDLKNWSIANIADGRISNAKLLTSSIFLKPGSYAALSTSPSSLLSQYPGADETNIFEAGLPSLNDDEGSVVLIDPAGKIFDVFFYSDKMHSPFLQDNEGVSLERLSSLADTNEQGNWKSCSTPAFYATPGLVNSNHIAAFDSDEISVTPEVFIPLSGQPDFTMIEYNFQQVGLIGNVRIYDQQGRLIKILVENELLGSRGFFRWDGDRDNGTKATVGPYLVSIQLFDANGTTRIIRKRVAVAGRF